MDKEALKEKFRKAVENLTTKNTPLASAVATVHKDIAKRVFVQGRNTNGEQFQYNSTKEIYIDPDQAPKKVNNKGKRGKPIKSGFYESYKHFRIDMGREANFVNWELVGRLSGDYKTGLTPENINRYVVRLRNENNADKAAGLKKRYGALFDKSQQEEKRFKEILQLELAKLFA